nr:hypothetical protein [Tanacetum cinerariifolium]
MDQQYPTVAKIPILDTGKFKQWQFRIQQYLQYEHYALWEVIEFGDSYKVPKNTTDTTTTTTTSGETGTKSGRTVTLTTEDTQKKKNDVKARTTLLLSLPDQHQLRFSKYKTAQELWAEILKTFGEVEQDDLNQKFFTSLAPEWLMHTIVWRNMSDLDTMSLDDLYNHLKVYESEVQKKMEPNSQNMAFISSAKHSSGNKDGNTACVPTASTNVPTASASDHALVADEEAPTEFALIANTSTESKVFENSLCTKDCKKNNDSLNSKITDLIDKHFDAKNMIYHYKLALAQVESRLVEYKEREVKYIEKIRALEFYNESNKECIETLKKKLETLKQEKEGVDGKLVGLLTASKDLDNLIESQRPSPTVESTSEEDQNRNPFVSENVASPITSKPFIKFVKPKDSQSESPEFVTKSRHVLTVGRSQNKIDDKGYLDSGFSRHMTGNISYLFGYEPFDEGYVSFDQGGCKITGKGTIKTGKLEFENVYFVKDLKYNLFSVSQICDNKNNVLFTYSECIVLGRDFKLLDDANILLRTHRQHNMYSINLNNIVPHRDLTCLVAKAFSIEGMLWHRRLGHLNFKIMNKLVRHNLVRGLLTKCFENDHTCTACLKGKQHKASCKSKLVNSVTKPLHTLHMDLFGPTSVSSISHKWYCLVVTDDFSRVLVNKSHNKTSYELFNGRSPTIGFLKPFGCHVMILNTLDHLRKFEEKGDEGYFIGYSMSSKVFRVFNKRTIRVEENLNVEFLENKAIKKGAGPYWLFDIDSLTKSMNYVPVDAATISANLLGTKDTASQEVKKDVSSLRYIALLNWAHDALSEFSSSKPHDHCSTEVPEGSGNTNPTVFTPNLPADNIETLTMETPIPIVSSLVSSAYSTDSQDSSNESNGVEADVSNLETTITDSPTPTLRIHKDHPKKPKKISDALQDPSWVEAMQEELLQFKIQKVWTLVDCPKGVKPIRTKWVLKNKKDKRGIVIRNKARLVAQGHTQEEGIDYDEVFAPVARIEAIILFLAYALFMGFTVYQMDVKSAFLYGTINEEVYVMQPLGFQDPEYPAKVYKVEKAMYGLHQAPRAWYGTLSKYLLKNGFQRALMHEKFQMSAMGELNFFLGLQVLQKEDGIFISQDKYVGDILKKFGYSDVRSSNTPMEKENPWGKDGTGKDGHPKLGLWYPKDSPFDLVAYSDSDYGGATQDHKSTTGGCQFLGRRLISWKFKKQTIVATSTTEAEYVAAASCCRQVLWIQNQLLDYGLSMTCETLSREISTSILRFNTIMARLQFCDYHNMVAILEKGEHNIDFHPMVDFIEASPLRYVLTFKPTIYVSHIRQFWSTARIETTEEGTKILTTVDGILRTVTESSLRKNLKLQDEEGISSLPDTELFENLSLMGYNISQNQKFTFQRGFNEFSSNIATALVCLATNRTYNFSKMIFDGLVKNINNKGEGSRTPTEPHHAPSPEAQPSSHTHISSPSLPIVIIISTALSPTVTPSETTPLRQYTRRARITQSFALPPVADEHASPVKDVSQGEACPAESSFIADQDRTTIAKSSTLPHDSATKVTSPATVKGSIQQTINELTDFCTSLQRQHSELLARFQAQEVEINKLKERVKFLEDGKGMAAEGSGDDALIKGRRLDEEEVATERVSSDTEEIRLDEGEVAAEKVSDDIEEMVTVLITMDTASVLSSGGVQVVPTAVAVAPANVSISTSSGVVPTASTTISTATPIFATATTVTPYTRRKGKEKMVETHTPKKKKRVQEQIDIQFARELEEELEREAQRMNAQIARDEEIAKIHAKEELQQIIAGLDMSNETIAKYLEEYDQAAAKLIIGEWIELISELVKYQDHHFKILKYQAQQRKSWTKKQKRDFYMAVIRNNLGWKVVKIPEGEAAWHKRKGIRSEQESAKKQKIKEEVPEEVKSCDEIPEEKIKELIQLVPIEEVYVEALQVKHPIIDWKVELKRLYEPDVEDHLWTHTQHIMHAPVEWRKALALVMICYKLQVENYSQMATDLVRKIQQIAGTPSLQGIPTASYRVPTARRTSHCQRRKMPLLEEKRSHCQKDRTAINDKKKLPVKDGSYAKMIYLSQHYGVTLTLDHVVTFFKPARWKVHISSLRRKPLKDHGFVGYPFNYRVTLGFGSIAGGLDHVNPVIRLPLEHGISRHDLNYQQKVHIVYTRLDISTRRMLDSRGFITLMTPTQALISIKVMTDPLHNWYDETTTKKKSTTSLIMLMPFKKVLKRHILPSNVHSKKRTRQQGSKVEEQTPKALMAIDRVGWDWSYMTNDEENHALVADEEAPIDFALMAKTNAESETGLPEFADDTVTDYSRPSPAIESTLDDAQNINPSVTKTEASPSTISPKPFIKFVKETDRSTETKTAIVETAKPAVKYAAMGEKGETCPTNSHKTISPRIVIYKLYRPPMRPNMNDAQTNKTSFYKPAHSYTKRPFQRTSTVESQYRGPRVPPVSRKFSTINRKFPTANRKFHTGNTKFSTADMGNKGKAGNSHNHIDDKGYWDSGCSRHMTGNISYLTDYEPFDGGYVSFGQGRCKITGKGTIKTECIVLGPDFKLSDDANEFFDITRVAKKANCNPVNDVKELSDIKKMIVRPSFGNYFTNIVVFTATLTRTCIKRGEEHSVSWPPSGLKGLLHMLNATVIPTKENGLKIDTFVEDIFVGFKGLHKVTTAQGGSTTTTLTAKLPILNSGEYDLWLIRIEQYFLTTDYSLWEVIKNGNKVLKRTVGIVEQIYKPTSAEEKLDKKNEIKARETLLMALSNKDQLKFHLYQDAKLLMEAIEKRGREYGRKTVPVENPTENALISQGEIGGYDWSYQAEEEHPTNCALMALTSSRSSSSSNSRVKTRLGYKAASPAVESFVNSSETLENQENVKSRSDKGYHAVPPPYTRNYIPPKPDLMFIDEQVKSESVDAVFTVASSDVKTVELKYELLM